MRCYKLTAETNTRYASALSASSAVKSGLAAEIAENAEEKLGWVLGG